jgi:hypothetical protein
MTTVERYCMYARGEIVLGTPSSFELTGEVEDDTCFRVGRIYSHAKCPGFLLLLSEIEIGNVKMIGGEGYEDAFIYSIFAGIPNDLHPDFPLLRKGGKVKVTGDYTGLVPEELREKTGERYQLVFEFRGPTVAVVP